MSEYDELMDLLLDKYPDNPDARNEEAYLKHKKLALHCINMTFSAYEANKRAMERKRLKRENAFVGKLINGVMPAFNATAEAQAAATISTATTTQVARRPRKAAASVNISERTVNTDLNGAIEFFTTWKIGKLVIGTAVWSDLEREERLERARGEGHFVNAEILGHLKAPMPTDDSANVMEYYKTKEAVQAVQLAVRRRHEAISAQPTV